MLFVCCESVCRKAVDSVEESSHIIQSLLCKTWFSIFALNINRILGLFSLPGTPGGVEAKLKLYGVKVEAKLKPNGFQVDDKLKILWGQGWS